MEKFEEAKFLLTHKEEYTYYEDGSKQTIFYTVNGVMDGEYIEFYDSRYYDSNILYEKSYFVNGLLQGLHRKWFPTGELRIECFYINGARHGHFRKWSDNGDLVTHIMYKDGEIVENYIHG